MSRSAQINVLPRPDGIRVAMPPLHEHQTIFRDWKVSNPEAQVLVAPCGTKFGKSFGAASYMAVENMLYPGLYSIWIGPTKDKARIGYRYMKAMMPENDMVQCLDGRMEIRLANNSYIRCLHGRDAEVTVEGEAVDRFVMDEAGKQKKQLWYSLLTTITQTRGEGIVTGTPRGANWYKDVHDMARHGDPFFAHAQLPTTLSPFVTPAAIENARRILPPWLFEQYYLAKFVSMSTIFGSLDHIWDTSITLANKDCSFWLHPDAELRKQDVVIGVDWAKMRDRTVFFAVTNSGRLVGYVRFRGGPYTAQCQRLLHFANHFSGDRLCRYDETGVGQAIKDILNELDIDMAFTPVTFTQRSKQEMVTRMTVAIESGWFKCPRINRIEEEFSAYEVTVTKSGLHSYSAPEGDHDDVVSAAMLAISGAYASAMADEALSVVEDHVSGKIKQKDDPFAVYTKFAAKELEDDGYGENDNEDDIDLED